MIPSAYPKKFADQHEEIDKVLRKFAGRLTIKNADERRSIRPRRAVLQSPEFKALWDRIKHKTTYRVEFDNERSDSHSASKHLTMRRRSLGPGFSGAKPTSPSAKQESRQPNARGRQPWC